MVEKTAQVSISRVSDGGNGSSESVKSPKSASSLEANTAWAKGPSTFDNDSDLQNFYKPIERYEGYHRYDPDYVWSEEDEKKLVRKVCSSQYADDRA